VNAKIRRQLDKYKRRIQRRLDKSDNRGCDQPALTASNLHCEIADRTRAIACGGIGLMHRLVQRLELDKLLNERLSLLKLHLPYHESDHILNIAYNLLAGGTCLEHLELLRTNEAYLDALGARRIPDPTTAGDFCRRFSAWDVHLLMETLHEVRLAVWRQQGPEFFEEARIDADGTMVETYGQCKQGMDINYQGQWGYHPLVITLANTGEPLYLVNRSGNRPSHEKADVYLDLAVALCRRAGFRRIKLRGDTDFTQTQHLDRWDEQGVTFVFGIDAMPKLYELAESLPNEAWRPLERAPRYEVKTQPRAKPERVKEQKVVEHNFKNLRLAKEWVAEFDYRPAACQKTYRVVVVWKDLEVHQGQQKLFDDQRCFFYLTNVRDDPPEAIVAEANDRCNQENHIQQGKHGVRALTAPLDNLLSNWAYMVTASLAWSLKAWTALLAPEHPRWRARHQLQKRTLLRMDFATFRQAMIAIPAQIVRTGRRIVCRLLSWNVWQGLFFRLWDQLSHPLRC
jgi:hypothetical protein